MSGRKLTPAQAELLERLQYALGYTHDGSLLVSGRLYQTACALERRGLATVRYQGPAMGWARAVTS